MTDRSSDACGFHIITSLLGSAHEKPRRGRRGKIRVRPTQRDACVPSHSGYKRIGAEATWRLRVCYYCLHPAEEQPHTVFRYSKYPKALTYCKHTHTHAVIRLLCNMQK